MQVLGMVVMAVGVLVTIVSFLKSKPPKLGFKISDKDTDDDDYFRLINMIKKMQRTIGIGMMIIGFAVIIYFRYIYQW